MSQFPLCSEFIPLLDTVKNQLAELKNLSQEFSRLGDDEIKQKALLKSQELERTKQQMIDLKEQLVEFEGSQIPRIEKELMEFFKKQLGANIQYQVDENSVLTIRIVRDHDANRISVKKLNSVLKLIRLFSRLQEFVCYDVHQITSLPELPQNLHSLECRGTKIIALPKLPDRLRDLSFSETKINSLPELPDSLRKLNFFNTGITVLPKLPSGLKWLNCFGTPAAGKPETRKQLEEFQKNHPDFDYGI